LRGGCFVFGTVVAGIIGAFGWVRVARIVGKDAMAREERQYARQDEVARKLLESNIVVREASVEAARHALETSKAVVAVGEKMDQLEINTNSKMDKLLASKDEASDLKVVAAGIAGERRGAETERAATQKADDDRKNLLAP
jgi:hypothetical protein